jgi:hypothetical protein
MYLISYFKMLSNHLVFQDVFEKLNMELPAEIVDILQAATANANASIPPVEQVCVLPCICNIHVLQCAVEVVEASPSHALPK